MATMYVEAEGGRIPVTVERKRVKNLNLRVRGDGSVRLSIPRTVSRERAQDFLDRHAAWIAARLERRSALARERADAERAGTFPLWGELVPLERALRPRDADVPAGAEERERLVERLYRAEVARALPALFKRYEAAMGVRVASWQVRRMTSRWGSCTPAKRTVRINSALAAYPPECLAYVVAHELTHIMEPSHNARFHMLLDVYYPLNREVSLLLKRSAREVAR